MIILIIYVKKEIILKKFTKTKDYSRFSGYGNKTPNYLENNIPKIENYAELGCPAWGMMKEVKEGGKKPFITCENNNFWNCSKEISKSNILKKN